MKKDNNKTENTEVKSNPKKEGVVKTMKKRTKPTKQPMRYPDIYEKYKLWKSLPTLLKGSSKDELETKFGIDDEETIELLSIRWQGDFAKKYGMDITSLTKWNKRMEEEGVDYLLS